MTETCIDVCEKGGKKLNSKGGDVENVQEEVGKHEKQTWLVEELMNKTCLSVLFWSQRLFYWDWDGNAAEYSPFL